MKKLLNEPVIRFLILGFSFYLIWLAMYEWWIHPAGIIDKAVINSTLSASQKILGWFGYAVDRGGEKLISIHGTPGLFIGDSCNGIALFALYSIFIIAFPGKVISKIIFIPLGILVIHFLNIVRVISLCIIETHSYQWTEFNHTYTFTILIYAFIFGMWIFWINKFSGLKRKSV